MRDNHIKSEALAYNDDTALAQKLQEIPYLKAGLLMLQLLH